MLLVSNVVVVSKLILLNLLTLLIEKISLVLSQHRHLNPVEPKREDVSETKEKALDVVDVSKYINFL